jgi:hypothetical protein
VTRSPGIKSRIGRKQVLEQRLAHGYGYHWPRNHDKALPRKALMLLSRFHLPSGFENKSQLKPSFAIIIPPLPQVTDEANCVLNPQSNQKSRHCVNGGFRSE